MQHETTTILDLLYVTDETLTADELAAATDLSLDDVEQALTLLEQNDFVNIGIKADHTNFHDIRITQRGAQLVEERQPRTDSSNVQYTPIPDYRGYSGKA